MIRTDLTDDGLKLSLNSGLVFDSGAAVIRPEELSTVDQMLETLVPYAEKYAFAVEGHTDSKPGRVRHLQIELGAVGRFARNAVRARLQQVGVEAKRIRVEGYADTIPLPARRSKGLSELDRLARHRRVVVRIY
jgi:flagellar motor protein MotB